MAESLLFSIAEGVLGKIASPALQEAVAIYNIENQIHELIETLTAIKAVLSDAGAQKVKKNDRLQVWLDRFQHVFYDAEDVLDELECEALRKQVISHYGGVKGKVCRFFSLSNPLMFRAKISHKIKEIRERLSRISIEKDQFDLNMQNADNGVAHPRSREMTYSFINKSEVVGRDIDKRKIIEMLLRPGDKNLLVISIVGIGGLGKTTLAKLVCNDDSVKEQFKLRLWVSVPMDFDLKKIIEGIIKDATSQSLSNLDIQQLQTRLQDTIKDKKYLLVLDDVWNNDPRRWKELKDLLSVGASESKIIVTTRNLEVASIIGTHPTTHKLESLSHEDSMALFKKWAFDENEKEPRPKLLEIGNDIVKKSQGLPLLVIILGSLLRTKDEERYWTYIRDSETWGLVEVEKDILPVLKLSYDDLPSHLKQCFRILSLFPRGGQIQSLRLTSLWMALGLISSTRERLAPEDVGVEYAKELWRRSLIQDIEVWDSELIFKVHDLVHSLATSVGQNYCSIVDLHTPEIPEGVRYISTPTISLKETSNYDGVPPFLRKKTSKRLRAIIFQYIVNDGVVSGKFARTCISKCKHLRILDLLFGSFEELPSSIYNLKPLRSLKLGGNKRLKKLPDTICELQSLLELDVSDCLELGELPKNMERLVSLRYLYLTTKQKSLQESGIQYLENLQVLGLNTCENLQVLFEGTCRLTSVRRLTTSCCGRLTSLPFGELIALEWLTIDNCPLMLIPEKKSNFSPRLRVLSIAYFEQVMELLRYLKESACTLESFCIYDCPSFTAIPEWLPNHTRLREIRLIRCPNLSFMPQEIRSLTALKELHIAYCGELSRRCEPQAGEDWHKIAHIPRIDLDMIEIQWTDV